MSTGTTIPTPWLFGGQLGPHFLSDHDGPVLLVESRRVFARRRFHRQKAHLMLSAMRHRAAELGERCTLVSAGPYREALSEVDGPLQVIQPTSRVAVDLVDTLAGERTWTGCRPADSSPAAATSRTGPGARVLAGC